MIVWRTETLILGMICSSTESKWWEVSDDSIDCICYRLYLLDKRLNPVSVELRA